MLTVKLLDSDFISIQLKYVPAYINRLKKMPQIQYDQNTKIWYLHKSNATLLDNEFKGEISYITPKWQVLNLPPPDYNALYSDIPNYPVKLANNHMLYDFQLFGANFCAYTAQKYKMACLFDDMGIGKTCQAIAAIEILNQQHNLLKHDIPVLVICKSALKYQWQTDGVQKFTNYHSIMYP